MPSLRFAILLLNAALAAPALAEPLPLLRLCHELAGITPYINTEEDGSFARQPGLVVELVERAAKQAQVQVQMHRQPWMRCIHELQEGKSDGVFVVVWQAERDVWGQFPGRDPQRQVPPDPRYRLWRVDYSIIVRKDASLQWDGQSFRGVTHKLSAPLGYVARQRLAALGVLTPTSLAPAKALNLVVKGRLDGYVLERYVGQALIRQLQLDEQLVLLPEPLLETEWYLPLSHQFYGRSPEVAERFWQALASQRDQLERELRERYLDRQALRPASLTQSVSDSPLAQ